MTVATNYRVNTLLAGVAEPAIAEAWSWIQGRTFPKDKPLIDVCQAVPGCNHFSILRDFVDPAGLTHGHTLAMLGLRAGG